MHGEENGQAGIMLEAQDRPRVLGTMRASGLGTTRPVVYRIVSHVKASTLGNRDGSQ